MSSVPRRLFLAISGAFLAACLSTHEPVDASGPIDWDLELQESAEDPLPGAPLPGAREIVDRFLAETGLGEKLAETSSMYAKGSLELLGTDVLGTAEIWTAAPSERVTKMAFGEADSFGVIRHGHTGGVGWRIHPDRGPELLRGAEWAHARLEARYDRMLKDPAGLETLETVGRRAFDGEVCYEVRVVAAPLADFDAEETLAVRTTREFYGVESGLLRGFEVTARSEAGWTKVTTVVDRYRDFGGVQRAARMTQRLPGARLVMTLETVTFDSVDPAVFEIPAEIRALQAGGR